MGTILWGTQTAVSRIWAFETLPTRPPSGASKWDYYHIVPEDKTYIRLNNQWVLSHLQVGKGDKGDAGINGTNGTNGTNATINIGNVSTTTLGPTNAAQVAVIDTDPSESNANLNFSFAIPRGADGKDGQAATVNVGTVSSLPPGSQPVVTNSGTNSAAVFNFGIPQGQPGTNGTNGTNGQAATIQVGTTTTLPAGSNATVTNVGTSSAAIFNFGIPRGADGASGSGSGNITVLGTTRFCYTEADLRAAVAAHSNGSVMKINVVNNIGLTTPLDLPKSTTSLHKQLTIDLGGNCIFDNSTSGLPYLIGRKPVDQTEALSVMQSWSLHMYGGTLRGKGAATGTLLDLGSTYNSNVHDIWVQNAQYGIWYKFCLMGTIRNCMSNSILNTAFSLDNGDWTGVNSSNAQSNHSLIEQCRVFNNNGAYAGFKVIGASGTIIRHCISEGGVPQYHIFWDSKGSTVVKEGLIQTTHLESSATTAAVKVRLAGGCMTLDGVFSQYDSTLIDAEAATGYPHLYVKNIPWLTSGSKLKTLGTAVIWSFDECAFDASNAALWVGGTKPYYWYQSGFNQSKFMNYNSMAFNGKTPVVQ